MTTNTTTDKSFLEELFKRRQTYNRHWPGRSEAHGFIKQTFELLFPHFSEREYSSADQLANAFNKLEGVLDRILKPIAESLTKPTTDITNGFLIQIPDLYQTLYDDAAAIFDGDPAAHSVDEVILAYPGFYAIAVYRIAHLFYCESIPIFPRILTEYAHQVTGIDIHPGAKIGRSFCIDHGTGIVIGETTVIGANVKIYQGVTLGALSVEKQLANTKRHPTIEDNSVIYAQATILGGDTIIGHNSIIGGNVWLTESVPPNSTVYHRPEISVKPSRAKLT